ncbi:TetR/AcrR family transcriptional regulator [Cytobacillus spongiae]|uniref:TetR/AcrR family transcriptional regulator n=1 Tax=Cytobacillus spongiae TaxID=2901381 RepID=UPI001F32C30E|nr:TetR/AcrR family transcriptional regulator [Cytobacillus spongiae]UII54335.1 TetR/AcrR family transcriptional regulator [Cytobacillus spongiae]
MSPRVSKQHKELRRANILAAAKKVFIQIGYERTTMKHIMDEANVSRGGLYQYFSNKEAVFEALLEEDLNDELEDTASLLVEQVDSYWDLLLWSIFGESKTPNDDMDELSPSKLEFFITGRHNAHRRTYGETRYQNGLKIYQDIIEAGQKNGEFSSRFPSNLIARTIVTFIDGTALEHAILPAEILKLADQNRLFFDYIKAALEVKES